MLFSTFHKQKIAFGNFLVFGRKVCEGTGVVGRIRPIPLEVSLKLLFLASLRKKLTKELRLKWFKVRFLIYKNVNYYSILAQVKS